MRFTSIAAALIASAAALSMSVDDLLRDALQRGLSSAPGSSPGDKMRGILSSAYDAGHALKQSAHRVNAFANHKRFTQSSVFDTVSHSYFPDNSDGFYAVIPEFIGAAVPAGASASWTSSCLESNHAVSTWGAGQTTVTINITSSNVNSSAPLCQDFYLLATVDSLHLLTVSSAGSNVVTLDVPRVSWVKREGVRIFRFIHDPLTTIGDLIATLSLFVPSLTEPTLDPASQAANMKFLKDYVNVTVEPRDVDLIDMDWSYVKSGDLFAIARLDGLGTMEQWGTGAATTHIVMAIRLGANQDLFIAESTAKDAYWPLDNIQLNAINTWIPMAQASKYAVVHLPLSDAARAVWNQTAAENFIFANVGYPYGYHNFIATFFDTPNGNLPWPASWQFIEIAFNLIESLDRNLTDQLIGAACNMRLHTTGLDLVQLSDVAAQQGLTFAQLMAIPEQDEWVYYDGPSMVCDVFYCNVIEAAGLFSKLFGIENSELNCREFHNLDVYRLNIYNLTSPRPAACVAADPDVPYCQIMGQYRVFLNNANTMTPYKHMNENCTALPLSYTRVPYQC